MKKLQNTGFTLVEIIVVVGIIAIMAGIAIVGILQSRSLSRDRQVIADVQTIKLAFARAASASIGNNYPGNANQWYCLKTSGTCWNGQRWAYSALNTIVLPYFPGNQYPVPSGTKSGELRHDAYVYAPSVPSLISGYTGPFLIWWQEKPITNCNGHYYGALESGIYYCAEKLTNQ